MDFSIKLIIGFFIISILLVFIKTSSDSSKINKYNYQVYNSQKDEDNINNIIDITKFNEELEKFKS